MFPYSSGATPAVPAAASDAEGGSGGPSGPSGGDLSANPADFILSCVSRATCDNYQATVLKIGRLSANSTKQLATDIGEGIFRHYLRPRYQSFRDTQSQ